MTEEAERPRMHWFRFYHEVMHDKKIRRLTPQQRWLWAAVMSAASESPIRGFLLISVGRSMSDADLADYAALPVKCIAPTLRGFEQDEMVDWDRNLNCWHVTNWDKRQPNSDNTTERTRRHRSKERSGKGSGEQVGNVPVTPPDLDLDLELEKEGLLTSAAALTVVSGEPAAAASEKGTVEAAFALIAQRQALKTAPNDPDAYIASTVRGLRTELAGAVSSLDWNEPWTVETLADWLKPPAVRPLSKWEQQAEVEGARRDYEHERPDCPRCEGRSLLPTDDTETVWMPCPECNRGAA